MAFLRPAYRHDQTAEHGLKVIEDVCQAHGTRAGGKLAGTSGDAGCFSTKDGKLLWSGEGGFILTGDPGIAARCRAFRTHWQTPPAGQAPLSFLGHNYRLAEPLAAIASANLARFGQLLARRQQQTRLLSALITGSPAIEVLPSPDGWNGYAPLARLRMPKARQFCQHVAELGVPNSEVPPVFRTADPLGFSAERTGDNVEGIPEILAGIP